MVESVRRITIDLWKDETYKQVEYMAKRREYAKRNREYIKRTKYYKESREYTKDMHIIGEICEEKESNGVIAVKENINEQLVLKLFTSMMEWTGTIEESISREISTAYLSENNYPAFLVIFRWYWCNLTLEKVYSGTDRKTKFYFCTFGRMPFGCTFGIKILNPLEVFIIEEKFPDINDNWEVRSINGKHVADINSKEFDISGQWDINIFDDELAKHDAFINTLILFAASIRYHGQIQDRIKNIIHDLKKDIPYSIQKKELVHYVIPRRQR